MLLDLCNRTEEYDHAGSRECDPRAQATAVEQGQAHEGKGAAQIESTVRYLGIEVDDALAIAEQVDV